MRSPRFYILACALLFFVMPAGASEVSRSTGVAPLSVHFSAGLIASTPGNLPFHDYEYSWDFGDPSSGVWGTSGKSKNTDKGPVTAHVYETAGTYTATLTVKDASGVVSTDTFSITVSDPDIVFTGTKTTCISTGSDFTGCPSGASQVTTSDLSGIGAYTDAGERVLLRRGDSWGISATPSFPNNAGPVHVGAFGTCSSPDALGICSNAPQVALNGAGFVPLTSKENWTVADISFTGTGSSTPVGAGGNSRNNLILRMKSDGCTFGANFSNIRTSDDEYFTGNAIVSSKIINSTEYGAYIGGEKLIFSGNIVHGVAVQHGVRIWQAYQGVINHNNIARPAPTKVAFTLLGPGPYEFCNNHWDNTEVGCIANGGVWGINNSLGAKVGTYAQTGGTGLRHFTQFAVVANNVIGGPGLVLVNIGPQSVDHNEHISDVIFEKNKIMSDYELYPERTDRTTDSIGLSGRYYTLRNNIIDMTGSNTGSAYGISMLRKSPNMWHSLGFRIFNNTIVNRTSTNYVYGIRVYLSYAGESIIRNNYAYLPTASYPNALVDESGYAVASHNVLVDNPHFVDGFNENALARDFRLTSSATSAIDQGATVPVFEDFTGRARPTPYDIGAYEYLPEVSLGTIPFGIQGGSN